MANDKKKKLHLTVRGVQRGFGQEETSEIVTFADYFIKNGKHYIFYSETTEEGQTFRNRLTISPDVVELKRAVEEIRCCGFGKDIRKPVCISRRRDRWRWYPIPRE